MNIQLAVFSIDTVAKNIQRKVKEQKAWTLGGARGVRRLQAGLFIGLQGIYQILILGDSTD
jgi:hypothetical protein